MTQGFFVLKACFWNDQENMSTKVACEYAFELTARALKKIERYC